MEEKENLLKLKKMTDRLCHWLYIVMLITAFAALFDFTLLNWISDCCEPGGQCIPDVYPQCHAVHAMSEEEYFLYKAGRE